MRLVYVEGHVSVLLIVAFFVADIVSLICVQTRLSLLVRKYALAVFAASHLVKSVGVNIDICTRTLKHFPY